MVLSYYLIYFRNYVYCTSGSVFYLRRHPRRYFRTSVHKKYNCHAYNARKYGSTEVLSYFRTSVLASDSRYLLDIYIFNLPRYESTFVKYESTFVRKYESTTGSTFVLATSELAS
jgi:hypothetical protein